MPRTFLGHCLFMFGLCTSTPTLSLMSFYYCGMRNNDGGFFFWWWKKKEKLTMLFIGTNQKVVLVAGNFFLTFFFSSLALQICALRVKRHHLTTTLLLFRMYLRHGQILSTGYNQLGMSCLFRFHFVNHCNIFFFGSFCLGLYVFHGINHVPRPQCL